MSGAISGRWTRREAAAMMLAAGIGWPLRPALAQEVPGLTPKPRPKVEDPASAPDDAAETPEAAPTPEVASVAEPVPEPVPERDPNVGPVTHLPLPRYVSLKTNEGNARRGPGLSHRIDWVFTRAGMPLKVTAEFEHWRRVEDRDGAGGWVHYSLLSGARTVIVTRDMVEFRDDPDPAATVRFQAEVMVIGKLLAATEVWARVLVDGEKGWAPKDTLWGVEPGDVFD